MPDPAVDLMSPEGTFIRAAKESWDAAWRGQGNGVEAIRNGGYPGFEHVFNNILNANEIGGRGHLDNPVVGTDYNVIVGLSRQGNRFTAEICTDSRQTATLGDDGKYLMNHLGDAVSSSTLTFGPDPNIPADQQRLPLDHQRGTARRPADNVFGSWVLFDHRVAPQATNPKCKSFAPGDPSKESVVDVRLDPPPTLPPEPGWPEGSKA
ncbi:hypothetical protein [Mycobacteroides abscessus]|uniref:hypothetical protein n=1 Tax=Mycobacteroides abscessus TaxID=36809 RepID=UPI00210679E1|nr:hypothetical protein [Mycobacteroides abscessus]